MQKVSFIKVSSIRGLSTTVHGTLCTKAIMCSTRGPNEVYTYLYIVHVPMNSTKMQILGPNIRGWTDALTEGCLR